ncbi:MAG TPA: methylenetetrahydrofolate reductase [Rhodospirillales bacterium]|jgi:methylenetetrahydrofolate reductase (NADPH)|nr:methylenetetrahydrofolate reductase [Rhodospirillales bacterium]
MQHSIKNETADTESLKSDGNLERVLAAGHFAVTAELGPPKSPNPEIIRGKARLLKGLADAVNVTDNQTAVVRMSSLATAILAAQEGLEPVMQMTCRDRNRLALQSDLLGGGAHGIRNVLCLSGDHQSFGNHPGAKNVHDIDSMQLTFMIKEMRDENRFQCGEEIPGGGPRFFIGAAANPFADPVDLRPLRLAKKVAAGADFIQTQPVFDSARFKKYMNRVVELRIHEKTAILAGVGPLKSSAMARYMRDRVPGMKVPEEFVARMDGAVEGIAKEDKAARRDVWRAEGIKICIEQIQRMREIEGVAGVHVMAIEWEEAVKPIIEGAGLWPRPVIGE